MELEHLLEEDRVVGHDDSAFAARNVFVLVERKGAGITNGTEAFFSEASTQRLRTVLEQK